MKSKIYQHYLTLKQATDPQAVLFSELKRISAALNKIKDTNAVINDCLSSAETSIKQFQFQPDQYLSGCFYALKDNIVTQDSITTGGSKFLSDYVSPFDATVYTLMQQVGAINVAKANLDEFGLGGTGTHSAYGIVPNYLNHEHIIGGSSSGSAYLVAADIVPFSIATDTGDSIRRPASLVGIVGFKPSYGRISRYGVFPFCPSLDTVGVFSRYVADTYLVYQALNVQDHNDATSYFRNDQANDLAALVTKAPIRLAYFTNLLTDLNRTDLPDELFLQIQKIYQAFEQTINHLKQQPNISVDALEFPQMNLDILESLYVVTAYAEAASCYANLTGMTFGPNLADPNVFEKMWSSRKQLGDQFLKRLLIGGSVVDSGNYEKVYLKSKMIRNQMQPQVEQLFAQYDGIILPANFGVAPKLSAAHTSVVNNIEKTLKIANFYGLPSISIPWIEVDGLPVGMNIFGKFQNDLGVLQIASYLESLWAK